MVCTVGGFNCTYVSAQHGTHIKFSATEARGMLLSGSRLDTLWLSHSDNDDEWVDTLDSTMAPSNRLPEINTPTTR